MKKLLLTALLLSSPVFADPEINITAKVENHYANTNAAELRSFHVFNVNNNTGSRKFYNLEWCLTREGGNPVCKKQGVELKSGQWYRDHYTIKVQDKHLNAGSYQLLATSRVNETVVESRAVLTVT